MTYKEILTLLQAGYTKDEINSMDTGDTDTPDHSHPSSVDPIPSSQPAEAVPSSPAVEQEEPSAAPDPMGQILKQLTELVRSMQANNRGSADMGAEIIEPKQQALSTLRSLGGIPENQD